MNHIKPEQATNCLCFKLIDIEDLHLTKPNILKLEKKSDEKIKQSVVLKFEELKSNLLKT